MLKKAVLLSLLIHLLTVSFFYVNERDASSGINFRSQAALQISLKSSGMDELSGFQEIEHPKEASATPVEVGAAQQLTKNEAVPERTEHGSIGNRSRLKEKNTDFLDDAGSAESISKVIHDTEANPDGVRQYRLNLAREARVLQRLTPIAQQEGWEGEVSVVIGTVAGGVLPQVSLGQGSGVNALDTAALEMIRLAVKTAVVPNSLSGKEFALTLPVLYSVAK